MSLLTEMLLKFDMANARFPLQVMGSGDIWLDMIE